MKNLSAATGERGFPGVFTKGGARENRHPGGHILVNRKKLLTEKEKLLKRNV
jgi:hypothetical protein